MSKQLLPLTVASPGFLGLNTQHEGSVLPVGWATVMDNFVYDAVGRVASRKGTRKVNTTTFTDKVEKIHEYVDTSGASLLIFSAGEKIYKEVSGTITDITGSITTPTANDWTFVNFNGKCIGYQESHTPIELATVAGTFADAAGTMQNGVVALSAYGRTWTILDNTLYYSDLLIHDYSSGSAGNFDLSKFWPNGMDTAVAIADFNGYLVVFGTDSIIVYESPDDVDNMSIIEGIAGIGCVARDSVQVIGKEIVFLSKTGLRSLGRTITEDNMPLTDISKNIRDDLLETLSNESSAVNIKSVYNREDGFYLLSFPSSNVSYMFDLKFPNEDGSWKSSTWSISPDALYYTADLDIYLSIDDGYISKYSGYKDNTNSDGSNGSTYKINYEGVWYDYGDYEGVSNLIKIPKNVSVLGSGTAGSIVTFKWALDYSTVFSTRPLSFNINIPSTYGTAQYGVDTYAASGDFERLRSTLAKTGQVIKIGVEVDINGSVFALQRIDLLSKVGRLGL